MLVAAPDENCVTGSRLRAPNSGIVVSPSGALIGVGVKVTVPFSLIVGVSVKSPLEGSELASGIT